MTQSSSQSFSKSVTQTPSQTLTQSRSQSQTFSTTTTRSQTLTPSPTLVGVAMFDGTASASLAILRGASNASQINATTLMAVSFRVVETDATCGPGRYSLTSVMLAMSQISTPIVSITVQLYGANVSCQYSVSLLASPVCRNLDPPPPPPPCSPPPAFPTLDLQQCRPHPSRCLHPRAMCLSFSVPCSLTRQALVAPTMPS